MKGRCQEFSFDFGSSPSDIAADHRKDRSDANMKKLILSVFIFTFGFAMATHAQQVNTLLTKQLPEAPCKEIEVITVNYAPGAVDAIHRHMMRTRLSMFSTGKLRCKFAEARFAGLVPGRYFTNRLKTFIP